MELAVGPQIRLPVGSRLREHDPVLGLRDGLLVGGERRVGRGGGLVDARLDRALLVSRLHQHVEELAPAEGGHTALHVGGRLDAREDVAAQRHDPSVDRGELADREEAEANGEGDHHQEREAQLRADLAIPEPVHCPCLSSGSRRSTQLLPSGGSIVRSASSTSSNRPLSL
jgi:hypothetical protein